MGKRGPQPKPQHLKELEGNPGKRRVNRAAPKPTGDLTRPDHLSDYAREVWDRIVAAMPPRLYTGCDRELLAAYCEAADLHRRAVLAVREQGEVTAGESGAPYQNPWVSIQNKQAQLLATLGTRLGLDPAARSSLAVQQDDAPKSKFEGLVAIQGGRKG